MASAFDHLLSELKQLPGLGFRSAERIALYLLVEKQGAAESLKTALTNASSVVRRCTTCGNLSEAESCDICLDPSRHSAAVCVVEQVTDLTSFERSGAWKGRYHVLHGKLSPIHGVGPENLNIGNLSRRVESGEIQEIVFALSNDIEGRATCHYLQEEVINGHSIKVTRIGFGLPSGSGVAYANSVTLKNALESRKDYE